MGNFGAYNENEVELKDGFEPLPNGDYKVTIVDSEEKTSKSGNTYISLDMIIQGGQFDGRHIFENLNVGHSNQQVVDIAHATIKRLSIAMGKSGVKDSSDLHGTPFMVNIVNKPNKKGEMTEYRKFSSCGDATPSTPVAAQVNGGAGEKAPWE